MRYFFIISLHVLICCSTVTSVNQEGSLIAVSIGISIPFTLRHSLPSASLIVTVVPLGHKGISFANVKYFTLGYNISPIIIMSGSWRSIERREEANVSPAFSFT